LKEERDWREVRGERGREGRGIGVGDRGKGDEEMRVGEEMEEGKGVEGEDCCEQDVQGVRRCRCVGCQQI